MANIITEKRNCTENSGSTYSVSGTPLTTTTVFTKTFTVVSGFIFTTPPSINFAEVSDTSSYTVVINDTGSIAGGNLTVRSFVVKYKHPLKLVVGDRINFTAKAELNLAESSNKIYSFYIDQRNLAKQGETRDISIFGDPGATLVFDVKNASNSSIRGGASTITIPTNGLYVESIAFPGVVSSTTYSVILTQASSNTFLTLTSPTVVTLPQYAETTITFRLTEAASNFIVKLGTSHTSGVALTSKGNVGTRALSGVTIGYNFTDQKTHWSITPQSSLISIKKIGSITANDWTGTTNGSINTLTGGSLVAFGQQERTIYPTTTAVTIAQAFSNTPGGTINAGTTLTFHTVMHINGDAAVNNFGTSSQNCDLDAAGILAFNEAPTAASQATISATRGQAKEVTLAATDPEGDALTFTITKLPVGGTLAYTDQNNSSATITCLGQTNQTIVLGNSKVVAYTSGNAGQSSSPQTLLVQQIVVVGILYTL